MNLEPDNYLLIQARKEKLDSDCTPGKFASVEWRAARVWHVGAVGPAAALPPFPSLDTRANLFII